MPRSYIPPRLFASFYLVPTRFGSPQAPGPLARIKSAQSSKILSRGVGYRTFDFLGFPLLGARLKGRSGCDIGAGSNWTMRRSWRLGRQSADILGTHLSDFRLDRRSCASSSAAGVTFSRPRLARSTHDAAFKWIPTELDRLVSRCQLWAALTALKTMSLRKMTHLA